MEDGLAAALRATPRLIGKIELTAYDYALRRLMVMQHVRFTGVPPIEPLEAGLLRYNQLEAVCLSHQHLLIVVLESTTAEPAAVPTPASTQRMRPAKSSCDRCITAACITSADAHVHGYFQEKSYWAYI